MCFTHICSTLKQQCVFLHMFVYILNNFVCLHSICFQLWINFVYFYMILLILCFLTRFCSNLKQICVFLHFLFHLGQLCVFSHNFIINWNIFVFLHKFVQLWNNIVYFYTIWFSSGTILRFLTQFCSSLKQIYVFLHILFHIKI